MRRPPLRALAEALGVALSALQEARKTGRITIPERGPVDIEALRAQWVASSNVQGPAPMADRGSTPAPAGEGEDLASARRRKEIAAANLKELELERERGTVVPAAEIEARWVALISSARTRLLAIPTRAKQEIPTLTIAEVEKVRGFIHEALNALAGGQ